MLSAACFVSIRIARTPATALLTDASRLTEPLCIQTPSSTSWSPNPRRYTGTPSWLTATLMPGTSYVSSSAWTSESTALRSCQFGREEFWRQMPA